MILNPYPCNIGQRVNCREWSKPAAQKVGDLYAGGSREIWDRSIYLQQKQHLLNGGMSQVAEATSTTKPASTKISDIKEGATHCTICMSQLLLPFCPQGDRKL